MRRWWAVVAVGWLVLSSADAPILYQLPIPVGRFGGLSGNFGEIRPNHWHYGLDFRCGHGAPIYAVADGYLSRVRVSSGAYGNALYLKHTSDSYTTQYGHLDRFAPPIEAAIRARQQASQQFEQEWYPEPGEWAFKAGDLLGYSGNTGYSLGPHLHFEVRDSQEYVLNPLRYLPLSRIPDTEPPYITRLALEPLTALSRVAGRFEKLIFNPSKQAAGYASTETYYVTGPVGLEFTAYDRVGGSQNANGVYRTELLVDGEKRWEMRMDRFGFHHSPSINQHIDYGYETRRNLTLQKAYYDSGNRTPVYPVRVQDGVIELLDELPHRVELRLTDYHGNQTTWRGTLKRAPLTQGPLATDGPGLKPSYEVRRNVLVVKSGLPKESASLARTRFVYQGGGDTLVPPAYCFGGWAYTLLPMDDGRLPVRAEATHWNEPLFFSFVAHGRPDAPFTATLSDRFWADFPYGSLFLPMPIRARAYRVPEEKQVVSEVVELGEYDVALQAHITLNFHYIPTETSIHYRPEQIVVAQRYGKGKYSRVDGDLRMGRRYSAPTRNFGHYCLVGDDAPPVLTPLTAGNGGRVRRQSTLNFKANDELARLRVDRIRVTWNGQWVIAPYNKLRNLLEVPAPEAPGTHTLRIELEDYAGNRTDQSFRITVY